MPEYELYHYGVPGMKWGVRRDARILANHRHNTEAARLKTLYDRGLIDSRTYVKETHKNDLRKKKTMADVEAKIRNAKSDAERKKIGDDISKMAVSEVPHIKVKRGLAVTNQLLGIASIGTTAYTSAALAAINPAFAAAYLGAGAVATAAEAGLRYVGRRILDSNS